MKEKKSKRIIAHVAGFSGMEETFKPIRNKNTKTLQIPELDERTSLLKKLNIPESYVSEDGKIYKTIFDEKIEVNNHGKKEKRFFMTYKPVDENMNKI